MFLVELREQVELPPLSGPIEMGGTAKIKDWIARRAEQSSLIGGRHEAAGPVGLAADRPTALIEDDNISWQVLVLRPEAINGPASQRRPADERLAGVHRHECRAMGVAVGMTGIDDRQLVGVVADIL